MRALSPSPPVIVAALLSATTIVGTPDESMAADHNDPIGVQATYRSGESLGGYEVATGDPTADIADLFAWYRGPRANPTSVVLALTWRADPLESKEKSFDPTVKYGIHVDTDDPGLVDIDIGDDGLTLKSRFVTKAEHDIVVWFGEHKTRRGQWGMIVSGLPGVTGDFVGPVGKVLTPAPGVKVAAGLFDDPFFADLDGFFNAISVALGNQPGSNPSLPLDRFHALDPRKQRLTRPFGYPVGVDGFGKQNIHAIVVELPASAFGARKLHVWGTTERKRGLARSSSDLRCTYKAETGVYDCAKAGGVR